MTGPDLGDLEADRALLGRASTAERVAGILRTRIAEGYFKPGVRLPEDALRGALGVSRNTLREAFRLLSHERLLVHELNRGVFVRLPTVEELEDLYHLRAVIECAAVRGKREDADLSELHEAVRRGKSAARKRQWQELGTANIRYHQAIAALLESRRVDEIMEGLLAELRLVFHVMADPRRFHEPYLARNVDILAALEADDNKRAEALLADYLNDAQTQLAEPLRELETKHQDH